jgi:hypothetical protein
MCCGRFGLTLHPDKTRFIDFRPARPGGTPADGKHDPEKLQTFQTRSCARFKAPSFDFLGFAHTWMKSPEGQERGAAADGQKPPRPPPGRGQRLVPEKPPPADPRSASQAVREAYGPLRLLRHHREHRAPRPLLQASHPGLEEMAGTTHSGAAPHLGRLRCVSNATRFPGPASSAITSPPTKLSREEPEAGNLHVRHCGG